MARPAKFDRETALLRAMNFFWERGYGASSMSELVEAMDMRPGSIYAAFGSKRELLLACIDYYAVTGQEKIEQMLMTSPTVRSGFESLFERQLEEVSCQKVMRGCLLINLLLELTTVDQETGQVVQGHLQNLQQIFHQAFEKAAKEQEITANRQVKELAVFTMGTMCSLRVMSRAGATPEELKILTDHLLNHAFGPS